MNRNRTASGEVPESQPSGDLAEKIARDIWYASEEEDGPIALSKTFVAEMIPVIRESLAPIREALEAVEHIDDGMVEFHCPSCGTPKSRGHAVGCRLDKALRLLRGEELSGNRGVGGGE